jgi:tetratricopeptide (TPR) repeat protein
VKEERVAVVFAEQKQHGPWRVLATVSTTAAIIALVLIVALLVGRVDAVVIEPFSVPPSLEAVGYTPDVVASRVLDRAMEIRGAAITVRQARLFDASWAAPDLIVPSAGISVQSGARLIRQALGLRQIRIAGEIVEEPSSYDLRLRVIGGPPVYTARIAKDLNGLADELARSAESVLFHVDPFTLAVARWRTEPERALEIVRHCLSALPRDDDPWALNLWGLLLRQQGDADAAMVRFAEAARLKPDWWVPHHNWGAAALSRGDSRGALRHFARALELGGRSSAALLGDYALALDELGQTGQGIRFLQRANDLDPYNELVAARLVTSLTKVGQHARTSGACERALLWQPRNAFLWEACADAATARQDYRAASNLYLGAAELRPIGAAFCLRWAAALAASGDSRGARTQYMNVLQIEPENETATAELRKLTGLELE